LGGFEGKIEVQSKPTLTDAQAVLTLVSPYEFPTLAFLSWQAASITTPK